MTFRMSVPKRGSARGRGKKGMPPVAAEFWKMQGVAGGLRPFCDEAMSRPKIALQQKE